MLIKIINVHQAPFVQDVYTNALHGIKYDNDALKYNFN